jgi:vancomycin permeability regulator SanA
LKRVRLVGIWFVFVVLLAMAAIVVDGLTDNLQKADVAIVLGNTVMPDGYPSPGLKARLDRAAGLYKAGLVANVITSGAPHTKGGDEADAMRNYLVCVGVPAARIIPDHDGVHTMETARDSAAIMKANGWKSAMVVSQYYHITRARMALRAYGVARVYSAHAYRFDINDLKAIPREFIALISYRFRLWSHPPAH